MLTFWMGQCLETGCKPELLVRTFVLSSAYRQVGLSPEGRKYGYIRVYCLSENKWSFFQTQVLPFGAVRSVHSFLRLARAI